MSLPIPNSIEHANMDTSSESSSLSGLTLDSGVSTAESIASGGLTPTNPPKKRVVKKIDDSEIRFLLESFCEEAKAPNTKFSINKFAVCRGVPKATLKGILKASGISTRTSNREQFCDPAKDYKLSCAASEERDKEACN
eukprot:scaffold26353_cov44-Attheya_sp.AAC.1